MSIQNLALDKSLTWHESSDGNHVYTIDNDITIVLPKHYLESLTHIVCTMCDCFLASSEDKDSMIEHGVCTSCYMRWGEGNIQWKHGWRPSNEALKKYNEEKHNRPVSYWRENKKK